MPRPNSLELHRKAGAHVLVRRLDDEDARLIDLGVLNQPAQPNNETQRLDSFDERGGANVLDESDVTRFVERYNIDPRNHEAAVLAFFHGAAEPGAFNQADTPVVEQEHVAHRGRWIALTDAAGNRAYNVGSVTVTDGDMTTYVAGADYILDAAKGMVFIPTNSAIQDEDDIEISFTPAEMTGADMVLPQTAISGVEVHAELWEVAANGDLQWVRSIPRARITSRGERAMGTTVDNWLGLELTVLSDVGSATPAGSVVRVK